MNKLKYIGVLLIMILFSACTPKDRIILVPQTEYYPTFPINEFHKFEKFNVQADVRTIDNNGTKTVLIITEKDEFTKLVEYTKTVRSEYNLLLDKLNKFNLSIIERNKVQNDKKPVEVEK